MRASIAVFVAVSLAGILPALAQHNPTADDIIRSLNLNGPVRGIRPLTGGAASAPATTMAPPRAVSHATVAAPAPPQAAPSVSLTVDFATNSAELTPEATSTLDELGHALSSSQLASDRFRIEGHTDTVGTPAANLALSDRRARAVVAYLEQKFGVTATRLQPVGFGERGLLVATPPQTAEQRNRRVQIVNLGT